VIGQSHRFVLCLVAIVLTVALYIKSHGDSRLGDTVAFLPEGVALAGEKTVRIRGNVMIPGVYQFHQETEFETVTKLTLGGYHEVSPEKAFTDYDIQTGDVVEITQINDKYIEITKEKMTVREKMILGIPLDLNQLSVDDWEKLPGIGPVTAEKIFVDRQKNGDYSSLSDLRRVSGVGNEKIKQLESLFK
jgi:competence protein ComEA